ncbi:MAG: hypothetical protein ACK2T6_01685 [Anaerolineae bacterium]
MVDSTTGRAVDWLILPTAVSQFNRSLLVTAASHGDDGPLL